VSRGWRLTRSTSAASTPGLVDKTTQGLFSGIGGLELGLARAGWRAESMSENWGPAKRVLTEQFPTIALLGDIRRLRSLNSASLVAAGFPCADLSLAGGQVGITGQQSGLVDEIFRLLAKTAAEWVLLENVENMLRLQRGAAMRHIVGRLEDLGYAWAYRTIDARFTGLPQRRRRVLLLASRTHRPQDVLLTSDAGPRPDEDYDSRCYGFYWTEGRRGLGLIRDAIPPLKGGSTIGLPSQPALWVPGNECGRRILIPSITDGERLQGFPSGWTEAAKARPDPRWKLVGNAVPVPVAEWIGRAIASPGTHNEDLQPHDRKRPWPTSAWGGNGRAWRSSVSAFPELAEYVHLHDLVDLEQAAPLSSRATSGFLDRLERSSGPLDGRFHQDVRSHLEASRRQGFPNVRQPTPPVESWASSPKSRRVMQGNRAKDTKPELRLRQQLAARGVGYRLRVKVAGTSRTIDIAFLSARIAVHVRGCFWHACPTHGTKPKSNDAYWAEKLRRNVERDADTDRRLAANGWHVLVVWEHDDLNVAADEIVRVVRRRRAALGIRSSSVSHSRVRR
jgi:DNA (cytosine-5)-methyltransferase 1